MREYNYTMKKALAIGLRPTDRNKRGSQALVTSVGMVPDDEALASLELPTQLDISAIDPAPTFPFPQIFHFRQLDVIACNTAIYQINSDLSFTLLLGSLTEGHMWSAADFGSYILMANGKQVIQRDGQSLAWSTADDIGLSVASSVCNFNGQIVVAAPNVAIV